MPRKITRGEAKRMVERILRELEGDGSEEARRWYADLLMVRDIIAYGTNYGHPALNVGLSLRDGEVKVVCIRLAGVCFRVDAKPTLTDIRRALIALVPEIYETLIEWEVIAPR